MNKPVAIYPICNSLSLLIDDIEYGINDRVIWRYSNSDKIHKSQIYNSRKGHYFIVNKMRYYLSEFCCID